MEPIRMEFMYENYMCLEYLYGNPFLSRFGSEESYSKCFLRLFEVCFKVGLFFVE